MNRHIISEQRRWRVVVLEPRPRRYVWFHLWIAPDLRGTNRLPRILRVVGAVLRGTHYIDFFPSIRTLARLAARLKWVYVGESRWFEGCDAFVTPLSGGLPSRAGGHSIRHRCPDRLPRYWTFLSLKEQRRAEALISAGTGLRRALAPPKGS